MTGVHWPYELDPEAGSPARHAARSPVTEVAVGLVGDQPAPTARAPGTPAGTRSAGHGRIGDPFVARAGSLLLRSLPLLGVLAVAAFLRLWQLGAIGFNSDEAVYTGSAASLGGDPVSRAMFPIFRAHPLLLQTLVSLAMHGHVDDFRARLVPATAGILTVGLTYLLGTRLYGRTSGTIAALLLAVMPYHVVVSRQVLLDGLMTLALTAALYAIVRYAEAGRLLWIVAAGAAMGAAVLTKETSVVLLGSAYAFFALTPNVRLRATHLILAALAMAVCVAPVPVALSLSKRPSTGQHYLLWQIFRRPNHEIWFYVTTLPGAIGVVVLAAAVGGLIWLRRTNSWRERILLCWIAVPVVFFTLWPVKGYQYLLPITPPIAVLAGRMLAALGTVTALRRRRWLPRGAVAVATVLTLTTLAVPAWARVNPAPTTTFLAGTGGLPGGREAGGWVQRNVPDGAQLLAIGPSMANVLQFYGHRRVFALSVSPNPNDRNPSYVPVPNPDRSIRDGQFQYLVWDSYSAGRAHFFADKVQALIDKYHGVAVYTGTVKVRDASGEPTVAPVIIIYQVRTS